MKRRFVYVIAVAGLLTACTPGQVSDFTACENDLLAAKTFDVAKLTAAAAASTSCKALASDALTALIDLVATKNAARMGVVKP